MGLGYLVGHLWAPAVKPGFVAWAQHHLLVAEWDGSQGKMMSLKRGKKDGVLRPQELTGGFNACPPMVRKRSHRGFAPAYKLNLASGPGIMRRRLLAARTLIVSTPAVVGGARAPASTVLSAPSPHLWRTGVHVSPPARMGCSRRALSFCSLGFISLRKGHIFKKSLKNLFILGWHCFQRYIIKLMFSIDNIYYFQV